MPLTADYGVIACHRAQCYLGAGMYRRVPRRRVAIRA